MFQRQFSTLLALAIGVLAVTAWSASAETIEFPSEDGLTITADVYFSDQNDKGLPFICLFHQAGFSRGEYLEIAPRLVEMGYNCMAVDARSGQGVNDIENETAKRALEAKKGQTYLHALTDIVAALRYAKEHYANGPLLAWGSSYSASLVLKASAENEDLVDGTLSFAPNNMSTWTRDWIIEDAESIKHPVFITSSRREQSKWKRLKEAVPESQLTAFVPKSSGRHGSRALWKEQADSQAYWEAVEEFLATNFPPTPTTQPESAVTSRPTDGRPSAARPVAARPQAAESTAEKSKKGESALARWFKGVTGKNKGEQEGAEPDVATNRPTRGHGPETTEPVEPEPPREVDRHGHPKPGQ